jgi:hypothetical protein
LFVPAFLGAVVRRKANKSGSKPTAEMLFESAVFELEIQIACK